MSNKELIYKAREWVRSGHARGESGYLIGTLADALKAAQQRITELEGTNRAIVERSVNHHDNAIRWRDRALAAEATLDAIRAEEVILRPVLGERSRLRVILDSAPADHLNTGEGDYYEGLEEGAKIGRAEVLHELADHLNAVIETVEQWDAIPVGSYVKVTYDEGPGGPEGVVYVIRAAKNGATSGEYQIRSDWRDCWAWTKRAEVLYRTEQVERAVECLDCGRTDGGCDRTETGEQSNG